MRRVAVHRCVGGDLYTGAHFVHPCLLLFDAYGAGWACCRVPGVGSVGLRKGAPLGALTVVGRGKRSAPLYNEERN